jgi:thymidylate kinase
LPRNSIIDANCQNLSPKQVKTNIAFVLIAALARECKSYCILSGYDLLPEFFDTDIDFMVDQGSFERMPRIIESVAQQTNTRLFHSVDHEISGRSYWLASQQGQELTIVQPDSASDYRHFGSLWLRSEEVLAARRWHPRGFWIPAAAHEFAYYLIKRINKRSFTSEHGRKLHRLYSEDAAGCDRMIQRFWKGPRRQELSRMASSDDWAEMKVSLDSLRREMRQNTAESVWARLASIPKHVVSVYDRLKRPTGGWIAIMGPDGSGKSHVISAIRQQFAFAYREVRCFHLRPKVLRRGASAGVAVTDPHGQPPRGHVASIAKVFFLIADYWIGYLSKLAPAMLRSDLIIFDRYIYDLLVDSKRVRYGGPLWLLRLAARVVPRPDLVILLDAPAEVLWSRKREVTFEEVVRQRNAYQQVARSLHSTVVVDASQGLADVIHDVDCAIVEYFAHRTAQRLHLEIGAKSKSPVDAEAPGQRC